MQQIANDPETRRKYFKVKQMIEFIIKNINKITAITTPPDSLFPDPTERNLKSYCIVSPEMK